jgi:hypothetical protein
MSVTSTKWFSYTYVLDLWLVSWPKVGRDRTQPRLTHDCSSNAIGSCLVCLIACISEACLGLILFACSDYSR